MSPIALSSMTPFTAAGLACLPNIFLLVTQYKASVHQTNEHGLSPLCLACQLGEEKLAEVLCECDSHVVHHLAGKGAVVCNGSVSKCCQST